MPKNDTKSLLKSLNQNWDIFEKYENNEVVTWCGGCGNYNILNAMKRALTLEKITNQEVVFCYDVGCNGNGADKINAFTIHGLHGRAISLATGVALARPELNVIAASGDGATFCEGPNHLIHAIRNNYNLVFLHHNNSLFALTTGQASATSMKGEKFNSSPDGVYLDPINPAEFVLSLNPSFVARAFSGDIKHLTKMIQAGLAHNGFAFIDIFQTCPSYNKLCSPKWFWERIKYLEDEENYDNSDINAAKKSRSN